MQSAVMPQYVVCPSVCLSVRVSVTSRYRDLIGWNTSKIISRLISLKGNYHENMTLEKMTHMYVEKR